MFYKVDRTYLTDGTGHSNLQLSPPYIVTADSAHAAAIAFVTHERAKLLGSVSELQGDKATATASIDGRVYVVFVQRGLESLRT
jgi:hypothetical protein